MELGGEGMEGVQLGCKVNKNTLWEKKEKKLCVCMCVCNQLYYCLYLC